jgi:hypothetical protein
MLTFSATEVKNFRKPADGRRWGQAFYDHFKLDKVTSDRVFCDELYNAPDDVAKAMVSRRIDQTQ